MPVNLVMRMTNLGPSEEVIVIPSAFDQWIVDNANPLFFLSLIESLW